MSKIKSKRRGFLIVDVLLGSAISAILFVSMITFSSRLTDFMIGPGFINAGGLDYALSPSRMEGSKKERVIARMIALQDTANTILFASGSIDAGLVFPSGRLTVGNNSLFSLNPSALANPVAMRALLEGAGATFDPGYSVFFLGPESRILGILRVSHSDSLTHRLFSVSLSIEQSTNENLSYRFAEPISTAQTIPSFSAINYLNSFAPFFETRLPDPEDSFSVRVNRLAGSAVIDRGGLDGIPLVLPVFP